MRRIAITASCLALAACASTPAVRRLAGSTGLYVGSLAAGTGAFVGDQEALNAENAAHLDRLAGFGNADAAELRRQRVAWTVGGRGRQLRSLDAVTAVGAEEIVAGIAPAKATAPKLAYAAADAYDAASKQLAALSRKPSAPSLLRSFLVFGGEVKASYDKLADDAATAAKTAAQNTKDKDKAVAEGAGAGGG